MDEMRQDGPRPILSSVGYANDRDLTPPLSFYHTGGGLVFQAINGDWIITAPDGSEIAPDDHWLTIPNAAVGQWTAQLRVWADYRGEQYALTVGKLGLQIYLPVIQK